MAVKADWHHGALAAAPEGDPFECAPIEEIGVPIDLSKDVATLSEELGALMRREGRLYEAGATCAIKDRADTTCHGCPLAGRTGDDARNALCEIGRRQEEVCTALAVVQHGL